MASSRHKVWDLALYKCSCSQARKTSQGGKKAVMHHPQFLLLLFLAWQALPCLGRPCDDVLLQEVTSENTRSKAQERLLQDVGTQNLRQHHIKQPLQYMLELYVNLTHNASAIKGNTVRSFVDNTHSNLMRFSFTVSGVAKNEKVVEADLRLFKMQARDGLQRKHHCFQVKIYQILDKDNLDSSHGKKLVTSKILSMQLTGWIEFNITESVLEWTEEESSNQGLLVTVETTEGELLDPRTVRFASGRDHHDSKKPVLVVFTEDDQQGAVLPTNVLLDLIQNDLALSEQVAGLQTNSTRITRSAPTSFSKPCQRLPLYVDFEKIGWGNWVIAPDGYNAYQCKGSCTFPMGQNMRPTNHATIQSIVTSLKVRPDVSNPCCVPDKLSPISLLFNEDNGNVVIKKFNNMVAESCGCH